MIFADTAAATTPDLTAAWIALLGVAIGAVITGLISWLAAERGHSAENDRWVREQRFEAIVRATRLTDRVRQLQTRTRDLHREAAAAGKAGTDVTGIIQELQKVNDESREMMRDVVDAGAPIALLGPQSVVDSLNAMGAAMNANSDDDYTAADQMFIQAARKALGIKA